jgi:hypothetical protein
MNVGPEVPGEFVSDDLRNDCARFLDELNDWSSSAVS